MQVTLTKRDTREIPEDSTELRVFAVMRNEELRLPFFLDYYRQRGVRRFFIVDNDSSDQTSKLLLEAPDVHVFHTTASYSASNTGMGWINALLSLYARDMWCLVLDADEFLVYPGWESLTIDQFCAFLDAEGHWALPCLLLDMYSDKPLGETKYTAGANPFEVCPYYETDSIWCQGAFPLVTQGMCQHFGGVRKRLFGTAVRLDKFSLFKCSLDTELFAGMHSLSPFPNANIRGAVLHFKLMSDFADKARTEAARGEHWNNASEYVQYSQVMTADPSLSPLCPQSIRFRHSDELIAAGVMRATPKLKKLVREARRGR